MTTRKPRRNDPCPCGSGKKYKHCCKPGRRERFRHLRKLALAPAPKEEPSRAIEPLAGELRHVARQLIPHASAKELEVMERLLGMADDVLAYQAMEGQIEGATQALEGHRAEFDALLDDHKAAAARARQLFSEERYRAMRYTAADVHRAFEAVGYPQQYRADPEGDSETILQAILHLADDDERKSLARRLMMLLPDYVSVGRYLDAWLIQYSAFQMLEARDRSNPFLAEMFHHGFDSWAEQVDAEQEAMLRQLGIDRSEVARMSVDELEVWFQEKMADPATRAQIEAYYAEHPLMGDQAQAQSTQLERDALQLLDREDAAFLLLSPQEMEPWTAVLAERVAPLAERAHQALRQGKSLEPETADAMGKVVVELSVEMASAVFTPRRLDQLKMDLQAYRRKLTREQQREFAMYAHTALRMLEREDDPRENYLLVGICFESLRRVVEADAGPVALETGAA